MEYLIARRHIKTGDVLCCAGTAFYSKIINIVTQSPITHVGIAVWIRFPTDATDRLCILEAHMAKGVRLAPLSDVLRTDYWKNGGKIYWHRLKEPMCGDCVAAHALANWNKAYASFYQFIIIGSILLKGIRYLRNKSMDTDSNRMHCSETVTQSLMSCGYRWDKDPSITTPAEVASFGCLHKGVLLEESGEFHRDSKRNPICAGDANG